MEQSKRIVTETGIEFNDVSEVFYFSFDGGRHAKPDEQWMRDHRR